MSPHYDPPSGPYTTSIPPGTKHIREGVAAHFGITRHEVIRDHSRCKNQGSEHCVCRGVDWYTRDIAKGTEMRKFLIFAGDKLGIQSAIFNNIVWGFGTWRERSPASSPHEDHVHGGINKWAAKNVTRAMVDAALAEWSGIGQEDWLMALTDAEQKELLEGVRYLRKQLMDKNATGQIVDLPDAHTWEGVQEVRDKVRKGFTEGFPTKP